MLALPNLPRVTEVLGGARSCFNRVIARSAGTRQSRVFTNLDCFALLAMTSGELKINTMLARECNSVAVRSPAMLEVMNSSMRSIDTRLSRTLETISPCRPKLRKVACWRSALALDAGVEIAGVPGVNRTRSLRFRKPALYPVELRRHQHTGSNMI